MPNLANITVKKYDGTTDIVFTGVNPAGGQDAPAILRSLTVGTATSHRPELRASVKNAGAKDRVVLTFKYPQIATNSTTGVTSVVDSVDGRLEFTVNRNTDQTIVDEAAAQFANLIDSALITQVMRERANLI